VQGVKKSHLTGVHVQVIVPVQAVKKSHLTGVHVQAIAVVSASLC